MKLLDDGDRDMVSKYPVIGFQDVIGASGKAQIIPNRFLPLGKALNRMLLAAYHKPGPRRHPLSLPFKRAEGYFSVSVGPYFAKCLPHFLTADRNGIYLMDAWPKFHDLIDFFITQLNIGLVFLSSDQATRAFRYRRKDVVFVWLPEGINPEYYHALPYAEKDIDVLQFGRKYDRYHEMILGPLQDSGRTYLYEKNRGEIVFPTRDDFVAGLGRTKVSICFPSSITHPERAGDVSTMTTRYLQSMAAKCLVVGTTPSDMRPLFDYDPVVQAIMDDPYGQLDDILTHFGDYAPLIEKNYEAVWKHHTWAHRWEQVQKALA